MTANLYATVLTHAAPSSNYRGESEENRTIIQKITRDNQEYPVISPESMRNALREMLAQRGLPCNRTRLHNENQLAVEFKSFPDANQYADDFLFGYMVADPKAVKAKENKDKPAKRDSVLRMNMAVALHAYRHDATFHQSPLNAGTSTWKNASSSALLHREVAYTAFQYPFALAFRDCAGGEGPRWTRVLLACIGELSGVAGGHARSLYEMAPQSLFARLSPSLVAGYDTYGFRPDGTHAELARLNDRDLPAKEFWIAGALVRDMPADERERLTELGAHLFENPQRAIAELSEVALKELS